MVLLTMATIVSFGGVFVCRHLLIVPPFQGGDPIYMWGQIASAIAAARFNVFSEIVWQNVSFTYIKVSDVAES